MLRRAIPLIAFLFLSPAVALGQIRCCAPSASERPAAKQGSAPGAEVLLGCATLTGTVVDAETGEALPGAHVFIAESMIGAATDAKGRFLLPEVPAGAHRLHVSMLGYAPATRDTLLRPNRAYRLTFRLQPTVLEIDVARHMVWPAWTHGLAKRQPVENCASFSDRLTLP